MIRAAGGVDLDFEAPIERVLESAPKCQSGGDHANRANADLSGLQRPLIRRNGGVAVPDDLKEVLGTGVLQPAGYGAGDTES